jgi:hypothetical protein
LQHFALRGHGNDAGKYQLLTIIILCISYGRATESDREQEGQLFATLTSQEELIILSRQLVQIGFEIEDLSPASPEARVRELQIEINRLRQRFVILTAGFDGNDPPRSIFSSNDCFSAAKCGANGLAVVGVVTPRNARHAQNNARVRLVGAVGIAFIAIAVLDPHLSSLNRSLLPLEPTAMAMESGSLAVHDNVTIIQKKPSLVKKTSWSATLVAGKQPLAEQDGAQQVKPKRAANEQLLNGLRVSTDKAVTRQGWQVVVIETNLRITGTYTPIKAASLRNFETSNRVSQMNPGKAFISSASEVLRR